MAVWGALKSPTLAEEMETVRKVLATRYHALKRALEDENLAYVPFNSGCFALLPVQADCEEIRQRLIREQSVGVIASPAANALRVAFCSMETEELPELVRRIARVLKS